MKQPLYHCPCIVPEHREYGEIGEGLANLEQAFRETVAQDLLEDIKDRLQEYNESGQTEVTHLRIYAKTRAYSEGARAGAMLAALIRLRHEDRAVLDFYTSHFPYDEQASADYLDYITLMVAHRERLMELIHCLKL
ncbi:hypothetical protein NDU88_007567 [Pleurodeles waltl]|uniref:Uncharacterized protein n=1 Tax=Pleurodeles waltl TaxID=8319 RepID=A0AAV7NVB5_PLEWA|nr:hypothetical protein NDU88_007567 [Pleurodeles waltl]